jgi:hypothetical protein
MNERGKSDSPVVSANLPNKATEVAAEVGEDRGLTEGNMIDLTRAGCSAGLSVSSGLDGVREVARRDNGAQVTALLRHVDVDRFRAAYWAITDFLGFFYGFRSGRNPHNVLDALATGISRKKVNWVLDADIRDFFG